MNKTRRNNLQKIMDALTGLKDQLEEIRAGYEEYFTPAQPQGNDPKKNTPQFSQNPGRSGTNPTSEEDKLFEKLSAAWK